MDITLDTALGSVVLHVKYDQLSHFRIKFLIDSRSGEFEVDYQGKQPGYGSGGYSDVCGGKE